MVIPKSLYLKIFLVIAVLLSSFGGCHYVNKRIGLENDNVIEETIEDILNKQLDLDIDLTPDLLG